MCAYINAATNTTTVKSCGRNTYGPIVAMASMKGEKRMVCTKERDKYLTAYTHKHRHIHTNTRKETRTYVHCTMRGFICSCLVFPTMYHVWWPYWNSLVQFDSHRCIRTQHEHAYAHKCTHISKDPLNDRKGM